MSAAETDLLMAYLAQGEKMAKMEEQMQLYDEMMRELSTVLRHLRTRPELLSGLSTELKVLNGLVLRVIALRSIPTVMPEFGEGGRRTSP